MLALEVSELTKNYGSLRVLKGVSLSIEEGEFFGLLGHNGAGKSTVISIITGLTRKTSGVVKVFGYDIHQDPFKARSLIGCVSQDFNFSQFETVRQVLMNQAGFFGIPRKKATGQCNALLKIMDLEDVAGRETRELSGGMKKRMMLARAVMTSPRLLILDEPTAGVDIGVRHCMWSYLKQLNEAGTTIILTTHYLEEVENLCHRVAILRDGVISRSGAVSDLVTEFSRLTVFLDVKEQVPENFSLESIKASGSHTLICSYDPREKNFKEVIDQVAASGFTVLGVRSESSALEQLLLREGKG